VGRGRAVFLARHGRERPGAAELADAAIRDPTVRTLAAVRSQRSRPLALLAQLAYNGSPRRNQGQPHLSAPAPPTYNGSPRRNQGQPRLPASGTLSPNPCQGPLPLDPAVVFSWSTGVTPRYPPANDGPDPQ